MRFADLRKGDVFELEGGLYEATAIGGRIVIAYELDDRCRRIEDLTSADGYRSTAFSDLRFNKEHYTEDDAELDSLL